MRKFFVCLGVVAAAAAVLTVPHSQASAKKISKYCQGDYHLHYGSGNGPSKRTARRAAIRAWADFTSFEYGSAYANFRNARYKRTTCSRNGAGWSCSVEANPCRRAR